MSNIKNIKQSNKKKHHNISLKSEAKTYIKKVLKKIKENNQSEANKEFMIAASKIDKLSKINDISKPLAKCAIFLR